jgi:hypothetical protein
MRIKQIAPNCTELTYTPKGAPTAVTVLFSYETPVAAQLSNGDFVQTCEKWSATTTRHIKKAGYEFARKVPQKELDQLVYS